MLLALGGRHALRTLSVVLLLGALFTPGEVCRATAVESNATEHRAAENAATIVAPLYFDAMAPLLVVDPREGGWRNHSNWIKFREDLRKAKALGIRSISVDVWWGLVQPSSPERFEWTFYNAVFKEILEAGLDISPILAIHRCGGNVGDTDYVPLPTWFLDKMIRGTSWDLRSKSEAGNWSDEVASVFADRYVLEDYVRFWKAFRDHFAPLSARIRDIIIGMGPAGELVYPSYHLHDRTANYEPAFFPNSGSMQAASPLALANFEEWLRGQPEALRQSARRPPTTPEEANSLVRAAYAGDPNATIVFRWYHQSLLEHGMRLALAASDVFHDDTHVAQWMNTRLGFKIPGVHWRYFDRSAQLKAGWLEFSEPRNPHGVPLDWHKSNGGGFRSAFRNLIIPLRSLRPRSRWQPVFTCAEVENCFQSCHVNGQCRCDYKGITGAADLASSVGTLADAYGVPFVLENALSMHLWNPRNVNALRRQLEAHPSFEGVAFLRLHDAVNSEPLRPLLLHPPKRTCSLLLSTAGQNGSQPTK